jgi:hypothetical protein
MNSTPHRTSLSEEQHSQQSFKQQRHQPTSNIKELHLKLHLMKVVYLQSVSIKVHTICNRDLIVGISMKQVVIRLCLMEAMRSI